MLQMSTGFVTVVAQQWEFVQRVEASFGGGQLEDSCC